MYIGISATVTGRNMTLDHINCTGPKGTFYRLDWERSEWGFSKCKTGYRYEARLIGAYLEDEEGNEIWLNDKMDLLRHFKRFECCFDDEEKPGEAFRADIEFYEWTVKGSVVHYHVPKRKVTIENWEVQAS